MVSPLTRRSVLRSGGALFGIFSVGPLVTESTNDTGQHVPDQGAWPMEQRDPGGTGHAPDARGPRDGVSVRWKQSIETELSFATHPTPAVANGRVYAVGRELLCVRAADGTVLFRHDREYDSPVAVARARAYRSPTLAAGTDGGVAGLQATGPVSLGGITLGATRWQVSSPSQSFSFGLGGSVPSVPVAAGQTVYRTVNDSLLAVDSSSGRIRWQAPGGQRRPAVRDDTVYVASFSDGLRGYDTETGEQTFTLESVSLRGLTVTAAPECLVVGTERGLAGISYDGHVSWQCEPADLNRDIGCVAVANGVAYGGWAGDDESYLVAVDSATGAELWRTDTAPEREPGFAPPAVAAGIVYIPTEDGGIAAVDATGGHTRWRFEPADQHLPFSPVAIGDDTLYTVGNGRLYALVEA